MGGAEMGRVEMNRVRGRATRCARRTFGDESASLVCIATRNVGRAVSLIVLVAALLWAPSANAGMTYKIDDVRSFSAGIGLRGSFSATEDGAPNNDDWSNDFNLDNARIYLGGTILPWLKAELNTECAFCGGDNQKFVVLDAILKFELNPYFNIWAGRLLVPSERVEMDGPYYGNVYENYKTPFYPSDFSGGFGTGGAGLYARDHGVNIWGNVGKLKYVFGAFNGLQGNANDADHPLWATRIAYQFLDVEDNPAYYTSSSYYGAAHVLTLGLAVQYQNDGAGSSAHPGDFLGMSLDLLFEQPLGGAGVFTFEGEVKRFETNYSIAAFNDNDNFGMFEGNAYTGTALYLLPTATGPGKLQPYVRYTNIDPSASSSRDEFEAGCNYIISGHNAKVSLFYQYGDIATRGIVDFSPGVTGKKVSAVKLGVQLQI